MRLEVRRRGRLPLLLRYRQLVVSEETCRDRARVCPCPAADGCAARSYYASVPGRRSREGDQRVGDLLPLYAAWSLLGWQLGLVLFGQVTKDVSDLLARRTDGGSVEWCCRISLCWSCGLV